jgi:hypothetical protein
MIDEDGLAIGGVLTHNRKARPDIQAGHADEERMRAG